MQYLRMESVTHIRWGPSTCRGNIPHYLITYMNLDNESNGITTPPVSMQHKNYILGMNIPCPSDEGTVSLNGTEVLMVHVKLKIRQELTGQSNKTTLDAEKTREVWSTEEEDHMCPGHFWICKFRTVPGRMN